MGTRKQTSGKQIKSIRSTIVDDDKTVSAKTDSEQAEEEEQKAAEGDDSQEVPQEEKNAEGKEPKRKCLRKRQRDRGHGTLNMTDIEHAKTVNIEQIDLKDASIQKEFGTFGALPVGSKRLWDHVIKLPKSLIPQTFCLRLRRGSYKFVVKLKNSHKSLIGDSKSVMIKLWLLNKIQGYSTVHYSEVITTSKRRHDFDLVVRKKDCLAKPMELRIQFVSESKYSSLKVAAQLHKIVQTDINVEESEKDMDSVGHVVLDGEDQTEMIRRTRTERARHVMKKKSQRGHQRARSHV